jgi:hypothetical protein
MRGLNGHSALFKLRDEIIVPLMKTLLLLLLLLIVGAPAAAQTTPIANPPETQSLPSSTVDPAAGYITTGQDEPGYRSWYLAIPERTAQVKAFNDYLVSAQVGGIVPTWQLLRTATAWKECGAQPFEVPPTSEWPHIIQTLRYVRDYVIPTVGPVEPVSVYRNPSLNQCAGGAPESAHKADSAIDMVPLRPITREALIKTLCDVHTIHGAAYGAGLGFYAFLRFHVDSTKFRRWNMDPAVLALCPPLVHPDDVASVGQPLPPRSPSAADVPLLTDIKPFSSDTKPSDPVVNPQQPAQTPQH